MEIYERVRKFYPGRERVLEVERACGDRKAVINFRPVLGPLLRKPGAFVNYHTGRSWVQRWRTGPPMIGWSRITVNG